MKTQHFFEDNVYLVSNRSVARNPMFGSMAMQDFFKEKMEKYMGPICDIINYKIGSDKFEILLRLKSRIAFEDYFKSKQVGTDVEIEIPESTYIFSQAMANMQVSLVKKFNYKFGRNGTMMAGRFERKLIESQEEMEFIIDLLNTEKNDDTHRGVWKNKLMVIQKVKNGSWIYKGGRMILNLEEGCYENGLKLDLVDIFKNLPPYSLRYQKRQKPNSFISQMKNFSP